MHQHDHNDRHFSESLHRGFIAWLTEFQELTQRRQRRRVRMWDPRPDAVRHLCVAGSGDNCSARQDQAR